MAAKAPVGRRMQNAANAEARTGHENCGPSLRVGTPSPCGCRVKADEELPGRVRISYCRTHGNAFEVLEALQSATQALDLIAPTLALEPFQEAARHVQKRANDTIRKTIDSYAYWAD